MGGIVRSVVSKVIVAYAGSSSLSSRVSTALLLRYTSLAMDTLRIICHPQIVGKGFIWSITSIPTMLSHTGLVLEFINLLGSCYYGVGKGETFFVSVQFDSKSLITLQLFKYFHHAIKSIVTEEYDYKPITRKGFTMENLLKAVNSWKRLYDVMSANCKHFSSHILDKLCGGSSSLSSRGYLSYKKSSSSIVSMALLLRCTSLAMDTLRIICHPQIVGEGFIWSITGIPTMLSHTGLVLEFINLLDSCYYGVGKGETFFVSVQFDSKSLITLQLFKYVHHAIKSIVTEEYDYKIITRKGFTMENLLKAVNSWKRLYDVMSANCKHFSSHILDKLCGV